MSSKSYFDYTSAWLEWKETCAVDHCSEENRMALKVLAAKKLTQCIEKKCRENPQMEIIGKEDLDSVHFAFAELEKFLYQKEKIKGKPCKNYIFEDVAVREGGIGQNIMGYFMKLLCVNVAKAFWAQRTDWRRVSPSNNEGGEIDCVSRNDKKNRPEVPLAAQEIMKRFLPIWEQYDEIDRIVVYCFFQNLPLSNPDLQEIVGRGKSVLGGRQKTFRDNSEKCCKMYSEDEAWWFIHSILLPFVNEWAKSNEKCIQIAGEIPEKYKRK